MAVRVRAWLGFLLFYFVLLCIQAREVGVGLLVLEQGRWLERWHVESGRLLSAWPCSFG